MFDANVQYAYVGTVRYRISPPAQLALPEMGGDTYPIEPGGGLDAVVAYDRAATGHITSLELHGARSSPGVLVLLGGEPPSATGPPGSA